MKYTIYKSAFLLVLSLGIAFVSCNDEWDKHYEEDTFDGADISMMEYLEANSDLSTFTSMVKSVGYDKVLQTSQSFTIWAPVNDALVDVDLTDETLVKHIVTNHIARGRVGTSGIVESLIKMQSGKNVGFEKSGDLFTFGHAELLQQNIPVNNGLSHVLNQYAPYLNNLKEYIGELEGLDSLKSYIYGNDQHIFNPAASTVIDIDEQGRRIYDSIFIDKNLILDAIGDLGNEDSVYTTIYPTNTAWIEAYNRIKPYFNFPDILGGEDYSEEMTKLFLVKDMVFRNKIENPSAYDSISSTTDTKYYNPAELFANTEMLEASNGYAYITDLMPFSDTVSWFNKIQLEAEATATRDNSNSYPFIRTSYHSGLDISENTYLYVEPSSTNAKPSVTFSLDNILSAKYNIYCVFVPETIVATDTIKTKVSFVLTYINSTTGRVRRLRVTPSDNVVKAEGLTKMLVTQFDFEFTNYPYISYDEDDNVTIEEFPVKLEVINEVTDAESSDADLKLTRNMRIDCIKLEPVLE
nr:fasciclin domain-containing protein [uncultured Carboxylicivirga sp.]